MQVNSSVVGALAVEKNQVKTGHYINGLWEKIVQSMDRPTPRGSVFIDSSMAPALQHTGTPTHISLATLAFNLFLTNWPVIGMTALQGCRRLWSFMSLVNFIIEETGLGQQGPVRTQVRGRSGTRIRLPAQEARAFPSTRPAQPLGVL